mmetsp:Transcript_15504/g.54091  ORF Transcript_15504/g.54091 Transcript_15504/m.54091 type:complete len:212 (+) Transcript_15504:2022-2657(+)
MRRAHGEPGRAFRRDGGDAGRRRGRLRRGRRSLQGFEARHCEEERRGGPAEGLRARRRLRRPRGAAPRRRRRRVPARLRRRGRTDAAGANPMDAVGKVGLGRRRGRARAYGFRRSARRGARRRAACIGVGGRRGRRGGRFGGGAGRGRGEGGAVADGFGAGSGERGVCVVSGRKGPGAPRNRGRAGSLRGRRSLRRRRCGNAHRHAPHGRL